MKKKNRPKSKKNILIGIGIALAIYLLIIGAAFAYYQSQRPNFRDLEKAFNELNIPEDWQKTKVYKVTGYKGLFCFNTGIDEGCPVLDTSFDRPLQNNPQIDIQLMEDVMSNSGFVINNQNLNNCSKASKKYYCIANAKKGNIKMRLELYTGGAKIDIDR